MIIALFTYKNTKFKLWPRAIKVLLVLSKVSQNNLSNLIVYF